MLHDLIVLLRTIQLFAHAQHNLAKHNTFMQDHEFLAEIYTAAEGNYDDVLERCIGLMGESSVNLRMIQVQAAASMPEPVKDNKQAFSALLTMEHNTCAMIEHLVRGGDLTVGFEQLLGDIANKSEVRQYKLSQRLK